MIIIEILLAGVIALAITATSIIIITGLASYFRDDDLDEDLEQDDDRPQA